MSLFVGLQQRTGAKVDLKLPSAWQVQWSAMPLPPQRSTSLALGNAVDSDNKWVHVRVDVAKSQIILGQSAPTRSSSANGSQNGMRGVLNHIMGDDNSVQYTPPRPSLIAMVSPIRHQQTVGGSKGG